MDPRRIIMNYKRLIIGLIMGAILGVICIVGANLRYDGSLSNAYLFAFWFNRVLIGLFIGLLVSIKNPLHLVLRGAFVGLLISFAFYSATNYLDITGFLVGAVYGVIIEFTAKKLS